MGSSNTGAKDDSDTEFGDPKNESASDSVVFREGERVLAFHGPCLYEAKVQKAELSTEVHRYYVHYLGWNKNWDEWVGMDRLLKCTEENLRKQKTLSKKQGVEKIPKSGRSTLSKPKSSTEGRADKEDLRNYAGRSKKRKVDSGLEEKDTVSTDKHVKIQIPSTLKKQLLDECEFTQLGKFVKLPRNPCVDDILKRYLDHKSKKDALIAESIGEVMKGLRSYFDKALPVLLLYKKELQQYREAIADNISPSSVYGAEHLLRLFVKLPEILTYANIDEDTMNQLLHSLHDFLKFLQKNQSAFFLSAYEVYEGVEASFRDEDD